MGYVKDDLENEKRLSQSSRNEKPKKWHQKIRDALVVENSSSNGKPDRSNSTQQLVAHPEHIYNQESIDKLFKEKLNNENERHREQMKAINLEKEYWKAMLDSLGFKRKNNKYKKPFFF